MRRTTPGRRERPGRRAAAAADIILEVRTKIGQIGAR